jgi:hypothetical protein
VLPLGREAGQDGDRLVREPLPGLRRIILFSGRNDRGQGRLWVLPTLPSSLSMTEIFFGTSPVSWWPTTAWPLSWNAVATVAGEISMPRPTKANIRHHPLKAATEDDVRAKVQLARPGPC